MAKTWRVSFEVSVADAWVDDGFEMTPELVEEVVLESILDYAYPAEKVVTKVVVVELKKEKANGPDHH